ncbi:LytTR family transcriptional regulator DNA-binding domain-containing protein [uncultured Psychroserpens sp.]|uniref:LytTR family transcriptional regulator DNA-binding domain-containing protein n=1 Tax=uncultured Psychroserpens sp. TaxID=255436 RepID=UPI002639A3D6|nr:LytTR family transcriptional regulator DNA-binding domain-containing protein [uncultured Psychroserpens sp.]
MYTRHFNFWRLLDPLLLGSFANLIINMLFNPSHPGNWLSMQEFVTAFIFCIPITEVNRFVGKKLEAKYNWNNEAKKRFFFQLLYLTLILVFIINVLGRVYHWYLADEFYTNEEILIINLVVFIIALILVIIKWAVQFYNKWVFSEWNLKKVNIKLDELLSKPELTARSIKLKKRNRDYLANIDDIRIAKSEFGIIKIHMENGEIFIFQGTLRKLASLLPEHFFFPVTRNIIIHFDKVASMSSSTYGKISVKIKKHDSTEEEIIVSRLKASKFRKWYNSSSL